MVGNRGWLQPAIPLSKLVEVRVELGAPVELAEVGLDAEQPTQRRGRLGLCLCRIDGEA